MLLADSTTTNENTSEVVESVVEKIAAQGDSTLNKILQYSIGGFSVADLLQILLACLLMFLLLKYLVKSVRNTLNKTSLDAGISGFVISLLKGLIYIFGGLIILEALGVPTTQFVAVIGILGLAVSLSIQNFMTNLMSGLTILIAKPYVVGNVVQIEDSIGEVLKIGLLYTELLSIEQKIHYLPNSIMASKQLINFSKNPTRRLDRTISISIDSDFEKAQAILLKLLENDQRVYQTPVPLVRLKEFGNASLDIVVRCVLDNDHYIDFYYDFNEALLLSFQKAGIKLAQTNLQVQIKENEKSAISS